MVRFAGYARKSEPKWPYFLIGLAAIVAVILVLFVISLITQWLEAEINKPVTTTVTTTSSSSTTSTAAPTTSTTRPHEKPKPNSTAVIVSEKSGLKVTRLAIASGVEGSQPVDDLAEISAGETGRVYCYTSFENEDGPQAVKHVWIGPGGGTVAEVELTARGGASATWSYINISGQRVGQWQVRVEAEDGTVLAKKGFSTN